MVDGDKIRIYENRTTYPILRLERDDLLPIAGEEIARVAWLDQLYLLIKQLCSLVLLVISVVTHLLAIISLEYLTAL